MNTHMHTTQTTTSMPAPQSTQAPAGFVTHAPWWRATLAMAALLSVAVLVVFWNGDRTTWVEKGLLGLLLDVGMIGIVLADSARRRAGPTPHPSAASPAPSWR